MYRNTPKEGAPHPCRNLIWGRPGKQDFSGPSFGVIFVYIMHIPTQPRITLLVHRILVVHTVIETQFLRKASRLATPPNCCPKTSSSPKILQWKGGNGLAICLQGPIGWSSGGGGSTREH